MMRSTFLWVDTFKEGYSNIKSVIQYNRSETHPYIKPCHIINVVTCGGQIPVLCGVLWFY